jgi:hypothetical protein
MIAGGLRRLTRERTRLVAVLLLAVVAIASSGIQSAAALVLQQTLDANWRGAYDILVTAPGATGTLDELLAPNSLSAGGGLSLDDVERMRRIDGVEVAAPVGTVAVPGLLSGQMPITIPKAELGANVVPQAFHITAAYTTDDGLGERVVTTSTQDVVVDGSGGPADTNDEFTEMCMNEESSVSGMVVDARRYPALKANLCGLHTPTNEPSVFSAFEGGYSSKSEKIKGGLQFSLEDEAPAAVTRITLVDPVAERALLGDAGQFLDPLVDLDADENFGRGDIMEWATSSGDQFASSYLNVIAEEGDGLGGLDVKVEREYRRLFEDNGQDYDEWLLSGVADQNYLPLIVTDRGSAPLTMTLTVEALGDAPRKHAAPGRLPFDFPDGSSGPAQTSVADASDLLNPFVENTVAMAWPGTDLTSIDEVESYVTLHFQVGGDVTNADVDVADDGVQLHASGFREPTADRSTFPDSLFALSESGAEPGTESAYSSVTPFPEMRETGVTAVPVGRFSVDQLDDVQKGTSYVPLGAYQSVGSTVTGGEHNGATMSPSVTGLGIVGPETVAIAPIASAAAWNQESPVGAVRVRVSGISGYTPRSIERMLGVADAITEAGYQATLVAGSSPTDVDVRVDDYAFGTMDFDGKQNVGTLGTVTQRWSELSAAARTDTAVSSASFATLAIGLASAAVLLGAVQFANIPRRRAQASVLRGSGFTRLRVARWNAAEEAPTLAIIVAAGVVAWWLSGGTELALVVAAIGVAIVLVLAGLGVALASRAPHARRPGATSARVGASGIASFGMRQPRIHVLTALVQAVAIAIVSVTVAGLVFVWMQSVEVAGQSAIAQLAVGQLSVAHIALGVASVGAGIVLAVIGRRLDLVGRAAQWESMRAMGWTGSQIAATQRVELLAIVAVAVLLTCVVAFPIAAWLGASALAPLAGLGTVVLAAFVLLAASRKASA